MGYLYGYWWRLEHPFYGPWSLLTSHCAATLLVVILNSLVLEVLEEKGTETGYQEAELWTTAAEPLS